MESLLTALRRTLPFGLLAGAGTILAIAAMEQAAAMAGRPLGLIPFVTSIVLVLSLPDAAPARPRALIGGHLVASLAGYAVLSVAGHSSLAIAISVGLSAFLMHVTRTMHPPAGIDPLLIVDQQLGFDFLVLVVLPGALALAAFASLWHRLGRRLSG